MAGFTVGKAVVTAEPVVQVDAGLAHRFTLVVVNDQGVESQPATISVTVYRLLIPIPPVIPPGLPGPIISGGST